MRSCLLSPVLKDLSITVALGYPVTGKRDRIRGEKDFEIQAGEASAARYIYDAILFSGLIFRKEDVAGFDASRFKNHNYFQVYLFLEMLLMTVGVTLLSMLVVWIAKAWFSLNG